MGSARIKLGWALIALVVFGMLPIVAPGGASAQAGLTTETPVGAEAAKGGITIISEYRNWEVMWQPGWVHVDAGESWTEPWHPEARASVTLYEFKRHFPTAQAFAEDEIEFLSRTSAPSQWQAHTAMELDNGARHHVVLARTVAERTLYSIYDIRYEGEHIRVTRMRVWAHDFAAALGVVQGTLPVYGGPPYVGQDVSALGTAPLAPEERAAQYDLFDSARHVTWSSSWSVHKVRENMIELVGLDGVTELLLADGLDERALTATAAEMSEHEARLLREDGNFDVAILDARELDNGQRVQFALAYTRTDGVRRVELWEAVKVGPNFKLAIVETDETKARDVVSALQGGVTIDGQPALGDIQSLVPDLFAGATAPAGGQATTPKPGATQQGGTRTLPSDGAVIAWTGEWATDESYTANDTIKLVNVQNSALTLVYVKATALRNVTDAASYTTYVQQKSLPVTVLGAVDGVTGGGIPYWDVILAKPSDSTYQILRCYAGQGGPTCVAATLPEDGVDVAFTTIRTTVTVNGVDPYAGIESTLPEFFQ